MQFIHQKIKKIYVLKKILYYVILKQNKYN